MTEEQYKRAIEIHNRLNVLNEVMKEISTSSTHVLTYADRQGRTATEWKMKHVGDLLDKHDLMIREEIKQEISNLMEEIKIL